MALFGNPQSPVLYNGAVGKTHTNLVVSEGNAPAERYLVSSTNTSQPFIYEFGPEGNQTVLIAKGKIVEAVGEEIDREQGHTATAIRVAAENSERAIGVNHHNVYDQRRDAMEGNRPTVITRSYIEVPLFEHANANTAATTAQAMRFGAAYGIADKTTRLKSGDFVVAGLDGNFKKFDKAVHGFHQVIGQVHNVNRELPPAGLLQYYTGLKNTALEQYMKQISTTPAVPGDSNYPYGAPYTVGAWRPEFLKALGYGTLTGIPFLTDGYFSAQERITVSLDDATKVETIAKGEGAIVTNTTGVSRIVVDGTVLEASVFVKLKHKMDPRKLDGAVVTYTDGTFEQDGKTLKVKKMSSRDVHLDVTNNTVVLFVNASTTLNDVEITIDSVVEPKAGIPTEWDYKGSVGAARIQLLR